MFLTCFSAHFQASMMKKLSCKYCNKQFATCDNDNVQSQYKEKSKLNSIINVNSGPNTLNMSKR